MRRAIALIASLAFLAAMATAVAAAAFPDRIDLPNGYRPEGIAAKGKTLYVGSIPTGEVRRIDARSGTVDPLVPAQTGRAAIGLKIDKKRLFVAGGSTGRAFVYDARTGEDVAQFEFAPAGSGTFVNDVTLARKAAYFTDSRRSVLYVVRRDLSGFTELALPDIPVLANINLNGIVATPNGKTLIAVQSNAGHLWRIDPRTGRAQRIDLGSENVLTGDGLLMVGKRLLYVVQNRMNRIAVIRLSKDLTRGTVKKHLTAEEGEFDVPTTVARIGNRLYLPNARFPSPPDPPLPPDAPYWVTQIKR